MNAKSNPPPPAAAAVTAVEQDVIDVLEVRANLAIEKLREDAFSPDSQKQQERRFSVGEMAEMVGRSSEAIRKAENAGQLPEPRKDGRNRRLGYTLHEVNRIRRHFNTLPARAPTDDASIVAYQNFKGGVGKSTLTAHSAQYMAQLGYRVLLVDCDPQASTTALFGLNPDLDVDREETLSPFLTGDTNSLSAAIRPSYFDQVDLIPSNLALYNCEYVLAANAARGGGGSIFTRLRQGLDQVSDNYDMIFIDPPPALGMISLSVLHAANGLVVPVRPATIDFGSTASFFTMLKNVLIDLRESGVEPEYKFVNLLINDMHDGKAMHKTIRDLIQNLFGNLVFSTVMKDSAEIDNAGGNLKTVYDLAGPMISRDTHERCKTYLNQYNRELEIRIRKTWPSHTQSLRREGAI